MRHDLGDISEGVIMVIMIARKDTLQYSKSHLWKADISHLSVSQSQDKPDTPCLKVENLYEHCFEFLILTFSDGLIMNC